MMSGLQAGLTPEDLGASFRLWQAFKERRRTVLAASPAPAVVADTDRFVTYLALGREPDAVFALRQCLSRLPAGWGLQVVTTPARHRQIGEQLQDWGAVRFVVLEQTGGESPNRHRLLRSRAFWERCAGDILLFVDSDTIVLGGAVDDFVDYDYVAPLWPPTAVGPWCEFGDGSLSLRRRGAMIVACSQGNTRDHLVPSESVFFSIVTRVEPGLFKLPAAEVAGRFGVEQVFHPAPFALHRAWRFLQPGLLKRLLTDPS